MHTVRFTVGGVVYELEVLSFTPANGGSYWDPPDPGEIELDDEATFDSGRTITIEQLIQRISFEREISFEDAATILFQSAYEQEEEYRRDLADDVMEYESRTLPREDSD